MKYIVLLFATIALASGYPSYPIHPYPVHPGVGSITKGPSSETIIKGPDGSVITSAAVGGEVATKTDIAPVLAPVVVPAVAPVVSTVVTSVDAPVVAGPVDLPVGAVDPVVLKDNPIVVPEVALVEKDPKIVEEHVIVGDKIITVPKQLEENLDLVGPSGTISTRGGDAVIAGPASTTIKGGGVVASIDKQPDVQIKSVEVKPVVAPVVVEGVKVLAPAPVIEAKPVLAPVVGGVLHPLVGHHGVISAGPVLADALPLAGPLLPGLGYGHRLAGLHAPLYHGHLH